ncbi:MAG: GNAT family N-acetyltransferase [Chroococcidiopsidaceae cyanobacterium CP_BM_RX_35]|nr:GNAT family N-acetyltransferase [Chroococcidiopsidaceae cyanobacterium CP_BM_RX_35]
MELIFKEDLVSVDWERLASIYRRAYGGRMPVQRIENIFRRSYVTRLAYLNGQLVGGVYAFSDGELDATVHGLAVDPDFQRRGIGIQLMKSILSAFPKHIAVLCTAEEQYHDFYRQLGFQRLKTAMAIGFPPEQIEESN